MPQDVGTVRRADQPADYARFGVGPDYDDHEDGLRETPAPYNFEWWYFEIALRTGVLIVMFHTKPPEAQPGGLKPMVSIKFKSPGTKEPIGAEFYPDKFDAKPEVCDVTMGTSSCRLVAPGVFHLELHENGPRGAIDGTIDIQALPHLAPPARIGTGHLLFSRGAEEQYFGWVVPVPLGAAKVDCVIEGVKVQGEGAAYHDHDWGDKPMGLPLHHWYWGRAVVNTGEHQFVVICANTVARPEYGSTNHTDMVLIRDGKFVALGNRNTRYVESPTTTDPDTGKPVADVTSYRFEDGGMRYVATFTRVQTVHTAKLGGAGYHRFAGVFTLEVADANTGTVGIYSTMNTTWELMWIGDEPHASAAELYSRAIAVPA